MDILLKKELKQVLKKVMNKVRSLKKSTQQSKFTQKSANKIKFTQKSYSKKLLKKVNLLKKWGEGVPNIFFYSTMYPSPPSILPLVTWVPQSKLAFGHHRRVG